MANLKSKTNYKPAVTAIKEAVLRSQYRAISVVNREQLSLYYGIGRYVSQNSRKGFWGTGAIERISEQLQKELPGLRGFSATNMRNMRIFYEGWECLTNHQLLTDEIQTNHQLITDDLENSENQVVINRQPLADDLEVNENLLLLPIRQPMADDFKWEEFLSVGFTHHLEIIFKAKTLEARLFYMHECATRFWNIYTLKDYLKADFYNKRGTMPSNFSKAIPDAKLALRAVAAFKDEYLLSDSSIIIFQFWTIVCANSTKTRPSVLFFARK